MTPLPTILVVDNDPFVAALIAEVLDNEGYVVRSAKNGIDALVAMAFNPPALTLFDMWLPDLSASELIRELHVIGLAHLPLVLMTTTPSTAQPLLVPGRIGYLAKPFYLDTLVDLVKQHVTLEYPAKREVAGGNGVV